MILSPFKIGPIGSATIKRYAFWRPGPAYTLVRLNDAFVPQSATNYQLLSGPRSISTASLQPDYLRPHTIDVNLMDAPLVGGSSPVRPGSAFLPTRLLPPSPPWPARLPPPPWEPPCPLAEDPPLPDTFDRWEPRLENRDLAPLGAPVPPRVLTLDVDSSSRHATFHLKAAARQRKAEQAKRIAGAKEELSKLDRRVIALSDELKSTLGGPPRAALNAKMKQATEEVRESKRRLWFAKTLIEREDEEEEKAFMKRAESRNLPNAPWTHADQQRLMFMEANKYLTDAQRKTKSLKAWAASKDIEAMAAAQGITCEPAAPPSPRRRPSSAFQSLRGPPTDSRRPDVDPLGRSSERLDRQRDPSGSSRRGRPIEPPASHRNSGQRESSRRSPHCRQESGRRSPGRREAYDRRSPHPRKETDRRSLSRHTEFGRRSSRRRHESSTDHEAARKRPRLETPAPESVTTRVTSPTALAPAHSGAAASVVTPASTAHRPRAARGAKK
jgi:hypothetical protein